MCGHAHPMYARRSAMDQKTNPKEGPDGGKNEQRGRQMRFSVSYLFLALVAMWLFQEFVLGPLATRANEIVYSDFKHKVAAGQVVEVVIGATRIQGVLKDQKDGKDVKT